MNFIRCDVAHRKLNGVGSSVVEPQPKPARMWGVNTIERCAVSHAYCHKRLFIRNMFVVGVKLVAIANGKTQGAV